MKDLIVQLFSILAPILLYQMFWGKKGKSSSLTKTKKTILCITGCISILFCITFPVSLMDGYFYDLRDIPLLIGILYGGIEIGLVLTAFMIGYRYLLGGDGVLLTILSHAIILPIVFNRIKRYRNYSPKKRVRAAAFLGFLISITIMTVTFISISLNPDFHVNKDIVIFFLGFVLSNTIGMGIIVFIIEKFRENSSIDYELQEAEKIRAVSHLAASITHEIRNPLTVIRGFIQLLAKDEINLAKKQAYAEIMLHELDRAETIISDYLSYARPQSDPGDLETVDVKNHILKVVNVMSSYAAAQGVDITTTIQDHLYVKAEPSKLNQVMVNLIKNAIEAMPNGGNLEIRALKQNEYITIDVIDQGVGMTPDQVKRLGSPFFTTKEKGTGLGLMVCYRIIEVLNGRIKVTSEIGKGTHFYIMIPAEKATREA